MSFEDLVLLGGRFRADVVERTPALKRGRVWCRTCGHTEAVDSSACLRDGWPKHCGQTMTIDSPEEQKR
jgi:hypothetical protein